MGMILNKCASLRLRIERCGQSHNGTVESIGESMVIDVSSLDMNQELSDIRAFYGERWNRRMEDEKYHYEKLRYSLLHKVKEVKYFFGQSIDNRKIVVFSEDCISMVQYLVRGTESHLMVHMRSSDVDGLLPIDLVNLAAIHQQIDEVYGTKVTQQIMHITIGSAHYYILGGRE